jgi:hypothetical protein
MSKIYSSAIRTPVSEGGTHDQELQNCCGAGICATKSEEEWCGSTEICSSEPLEEWTLCTAWGMCLANCCQRLALDQLHVRSHILLEGVPANDGARLW